jgi:hypothetical protein
LQRGRDAPAGRYLLGDGAHLVLRLAQAPLALAQQRGQRRLDHLLVQQLLAVVLRAERELARRAREQVALQPVAEGADGRQRLRVGLVELGAARGVEARAAGALEHLRDDALEEGDAAGGLRDGGLGEESRRVVEVLPSLREQPRYLPLAREHRRQPLLDGREVALEDVVYRGGDEACVEPRVAPPRAHVFEFEEPRARVRAEHEVVVTRVGRQPPLGDARQLGEHAAQPPRLARDRLGVALFELRVELVQPGRRGLRRVEGVVAAQVRLAYLRDARVRRAVRGRDARRARAAAARRPAALRRRDLDRPERRADGERDERRRKLPSHEAETPSEEPGRESLTPGKGRRRAEVRLAQSGTSFQFSVFSFQNDASESARVNVRPAGSES